MFAPEEQQLQICLLKYNLEEIGNDLVMQHSGFPQLAGENKLTYGKAIALQHVSCALNSEMEQLKLEDVNLTSIRMKLKKQSEDVNKFLVEARESRAELVNLIKEEDQAIELKIRKYEESLHEKADRFRETKKYYKQEEVEYESAVFNEKVIKLKIEEERPRQYIKNLQNELTSLVPDLPKNLLEIVGKDYLKAKLKSLTNEAAELGVKRARLVKRKKMGL